LAKIVETEYSAQIIIKKSFFELLEVRNIVTK